MPASAIAGIAAGAIASAAPGATFASVATAAAISAAASAAATAVARSQAKSAQNRALREQAQDRTFTNRGPVMPHLIAYGRTRIGGTLFFAHSTRGGDESNSMLHQVQVLACHEIDALEQVWLNETVASINVRGYVMNAYVRASTWNRDVILDEAGNYQNPDPSFTIESVSSFIRPLVEGDENETVQPTINDTLNRVEFGAAYAGRTAYLTATGTLSFIRLQWKLGTSTQDAFADLIAEAPDKWTAAHRARGRAVLYSRIRVYANVFPDGLPNITAVIRGKKVYDPRSGLTVWSRNAALCIADYINSAYGYGAPYGTEIDNTLLSAAANTCDEAVTLAAGGTEPRFTLDGTVSTAAKPRDNLASMLTSCGGVAVPVGGVWRIQPAAYVAPAETFTIGDFRGPIKATTLQSKRSLCNGVKGTFIGAVNNYQAADFPPVVNATYTTQDQGERVWKDLELPYTQTASACQRLAKIELERARQQIVVELVVSLKGLRVAIGDTVSLTLARWGWTAKVFEVVGWRLTQGRDGALAVGLTLRETAAGVFAWNSGEETTVDLAPNTDLPDGSTIAAPASLTVEEELYISRAVVQSRTVLRWPEVRDAFANGYRVEYRLFGAADWIVLPSLPLGALQATIDALEGDYEFRVAAVNIFGNVGGFITRRVQINGLAAAPAALAGFTVSTAGGLAILQWTQAPELDVVVGGSIEIRHSNATSGATWATATTIGAPYPGSSSLAVVPLKPGTYLIRPFDSSGTPGGISSFATDGATALTFSTLGTLTEETAFSGTKTNTTVVSSKLRISSSGNVDAVASFDAIADLDGLGGTLSSGSYAFATTLDLTTQKRVRLSGYIAAQIVSVLDRVDSRSNEVDGWPTWDGVDGDEADAWIEVRDSLDGSTYSAWRRLDAGEANTRYVQARAQLITSSPDYNIELSALRVTAAEVV